MAKKRPKKGLRVPGTPRPTRPPDPEEEERKRIWRLSKEERDEARLRQMLGREPTYMERVMGPNYLAIHQTAWGLSDEDLRREADALNANDSGDAKKAAIRDLDAVIRDLDTDRGLPPPM